MLDELHIVGGRSLEGSVKVSGAKNSVLPILMSCLLSKGRCRISNVPDLDDIGVTLSLLRSLGAEVHTFSAADSGKHTVEISTPQVISGVAPYRYVKALRASFWVLGPLIARGVNAQVALPGGDAIGSRPVDLHLKGLMALGAEVRLKHGVVYGSAPAGLHPARIILDYPSVGATHQLLMAASLIPGETTILGAACEPEVEELAAVLRQMGAEIDGAGSDCLRVHGRAELGDVDYEVEGDRIEAATYLISAAITRGRVNVKGIEARKLQAVLDLLQEAGCNIISSENSVTLTASERLKAVSFATAPFPGIPTDVQPLLMAALCTADGVSRVEETVFDNRWGHVAEFRRLGAKINLEAKVAHIEGQAQLTGAPVEVADIRAGAGLVLLGLAASGITALSELHHLDRGYENLVQKFKQLGADMIRVPLLEAREITAGC